MKNSAVLSVILLLLSFMAYGLDPPVKLWEKWYSFPYHSGCFFKDIEITPDGNLFITGYSTDFSAPDTSGYCAFLLDMNGNVLWAADYTRYSMFGQDGVVLPDGSMAITGYGQSQYGSSRELFIMKINQDGSSAWTKVYDYPDTKEAGYGITCLPDGGFAVCGRVHGTGISWGQAWILRTDSYGDTLWTKEWGRISSNSTDYGKSVLYVNDMLCVLTMGADDTLQTGGTHLLFYDLDGNYLYGSDYPNLDYYFPGDICKASDGGVTFVTETLPVIWHTDQYGETLWWHSIPEPFGSGTNHEGFCVRRTMDSGFVFSGWGGETPEWDQRSANELSTTEINETYDTQDGWLARYDSDGELLWTFQNCTGTSNHFYSVVQLPQGGYMACGTWGGSGYLVRYAPETGISSPDPAASLSIQVSPNPFNSQLSVSFNLPEAGNASVRIYDLSGRLISTVTEGLFPAGSNSVEWDVPVELSSGCYFVQYNSELGSRTESVVLIK